MKRSDSVTPEAIALNEGRDVYEGGADRAESQDVRRIMLEQLPADRFLDQEHLTECATGTHGGPNDPYRRLLLMKAGANVSRQLMLSPSELEDFAVRIGAEKK